MAGDPFENPYDMQRFCIMGTTFDCPNRYRLIRLIGQGAYGIVCSAEDVLTGDKVAIKKIPGVADNTMDCKRTLRELRLLRHVQHDNVVILKDVYISSLYEEFRDVYTVTELMDTDLHQVISSSQPLTDDHLQYFTYQILRALRHIHGANVLHRDLKPSNILLSGSCDLKICDFGLARVVDDYHVNLTAYVATRYYRAPELLLSDTEYTKAVDMWSVGCILGEMVLRRPLFPGSDHIQQLQLITDLTGSPSEAEVAAISSQQARQFVLRDLMNKPAKPMHDVFPEASPLLQELLGKMLVLNPNTRITVDQALQHPYLESLRSLDEEPEYGTPFRFEFDESPNVERETLKRGIWQEAQLYRQS